MGSEIQMHFPDLVLAWDDDQAFKVSSRVVIWICLIGKDLVNIGIMAWLSIIMVQSVSVDLCFISSHKISEVQNFGWMTMMHTTNKKKLKCVSIYLDIEQDLEKGL